MLRAGADSNLPSSGDMPCTIFEFALGYQSAVRWPVSFAFHTDID